MDIRILLSAGLMLVGTSAVAATAQTGAASTIGSFKQWTAYKSSEADGKMCFIASQPTNSKYAPSAPKARDQVYFMVTIIPAKKIKNETLKRMAS